MRKTKSAILEAVHETANGLSDAGVIDQVTMREFDRLSLPPVEPLEPTRTGGQIVKAVVVLRAANQPTPELVKELQDFVKRAIAPYKYPRAIEFRAQLPRTETGKLQRLRLRDRL